MSRSAGPGGSGVSSTGPYGPGQGGWTTDSRERDERGLRVEVLACQSAFIPVEMASGFSAEVSAAVPRAGRMIRERFAALLGM